MSRTRGLPNVPELRNKLLFTAAMLVVYRLGSFVPAPGINGDALSEFFARSQNTIFGLFNLFSGGSLERFSIFALGIMPYITASIVVQVLTGAFPALDKLQKEGELGRRKLTQYTRYGTLVLALIQGFAMALALEKSSGPNGAVIVPNPGLGFRLSTALTFTTGTAFLMWLGEKMTERGVGNGISLLIYAGIVVRLPGALSNSFQLVRTGEIGIVPLLFLGIFAVGVVAAIVFMETAYRKIPVQYAKRVSGRKVYGGQSTHLPLKVNTAGVIPPIFASSLLMFPLTITQFSDAVWVQKLQSFINPTGLAYNLFYLLLIVFFAYLYTGIQFNPDDVADNLKKWGGFIPGIRPGVQTSERIDFILSRITLIGAIYIAVVCILPSFLIVEFKAPFWFGGTALLIVVGVAMDTMQQIESSVMAHSYDGLMGGQSLRGRKKSR